VIQNGHLFQPNLSFFNLKKRIKKNEGFSIKPYKDQLGFLTVGYGHLIKNGEEKKFYKKNTKKELEYIFEKDFQKATSDFRRMFRKENYNIKQRELLIEMIFQLGIDGVLKFKKMFFYLNKKKDYMVCLEMMDSVWYKQTPQRVGNLIKNFIKR